MGKVKRFIGVLVVISDTNRSSNVCIEPVTDATKIAVSPLVMLFQVPKVRNVYPDTLEWAQCEREQTIGLSFHWVNTGKML